MRQCYHPNHSGGIGRRGAGKLLFWKKGYADLWKLYNIEQLHREVAEQLSGKVVPAHMGENQFRISTMFGMST